SGTAAASALAMAANNGYTNDQTNSIVTVHIPPESGQYQGKRGYAEVIVEFKQSRSFSNLFGSGRIPVKGRAVALGMPLAGDVGILVLDKTGKGTFNAQGSGTSTVEGTPIIVDSNHPEAAIAGGGGTVVAPEFDITGSWTTS